MFFILNTQYKVLCIFLFEFVEQKFASRYEIVSWILENQIFRRNVNQVTRLYLIGRRYLVEKKEEGNPNGFDKINQLDQNDQVGESKSTREKIASQLKIGTGTISSAKDLDLLKSLSKKLTIK